MSQTPKIRTPKFCWGCGADLNQGQKFCTRCGKSVNAKKPAANTLKKSQYGKPNSSSQIAKKITPVKETLRVKEPLPPASPPSGGTVEQPQPPLNPEDLVKVQKVVSDLSELNFSKRFETLEYKINALDSENKLIELKHDVADLKSEVLKANSNVKFEELVSKDDLIGLL